MMRYLFVLLCLVAAVYAAPKHSLRLPRVLPMVGDVFGPVVTANSPEDPERLKLHENQLTWFLDIDNGDHLSGKVLKDFKTVQEMESYIRNGMNNETVVIKIDPNRLYGKYLEVLWSKAITNNALKMICHYPGKNPSFCHLPGQIKQTYSMVRLLDDNTVFPAVFLSHKACPTGLQCYWVSHPIAVAVVDKSII